MLQSMADQSDSEADLRHLLNTYVQADSSVPLGELGGRSLTDLTIKID